MTYGLRVDHVVDTLQNGSRRVRYVLLEFSSWDREESRDWCWVGEPRFVEERGLNSNGHIRTVLSRSNHDNDEVGDVDPHSEVAKPAHVLQAAKPTHGNTNNL